MTIIDDDVSITAQGGQGDESDGLVTLTGALVADFGPGDTGTVSLSATGATWNAGSNTLTADNGTWKVVVNSNGTYTFTQLAAFTHSDPTNPNDPFNIPITATATDNMVPANSNTAAFTITVLDDAPSITVSAVAAADALVVDETVLATNATANFADNFSNSPNFGADGGSSISSVYRLGISATGADSGLVDTATGDHVLLRVNGSGVVEGYTSGHGNLVVFTVSVNGSGTVTLDQVRALVHPTASNPDSDETVTLSAAGLVTLTRTDTITDGDGDQSTGFASINIGTALVFHDDGPSITASNLVIPNVADTYTGAYHFVVGADTEAFASSFGSGSLEWTNSAGSGYTLVYNAALSNSTTEVYDAVNGTNTFFTVAVNSDGTYNFDLVTPSPITISPPVDVLSGIAGGSNLSSYTIGSSTFGGFFSLVLTGTSGGNPDTITISSTQLGVGDNVMQGNFSDVLKLDVVPVPGMTSTLTDLTIHMGTTAGIKITDSVTLTTHYTTGADITVSQAIGSDYSVTYTFDLTRTVDYVTLTPANSSTSFKIDGVSLNYEHPVFPANYELDFKLTGADADLDTASATFAVAVNTTSTGTYTIYDTAGNDSIYGTSGSDTFAWRLGETGTDVIKDFNLAPAASGGDVLDLKDLLTGEHANAGSLDAYLDFSANGSGQTVISVHVDGASAVTQTITLENVTFAALQAYAGSSDATIITNLLANGNLKTDV